MPKLSSSTLATVARQLVVHEALDTSACLMGSYCCSLTPRTTVMSGSLAGAVITTFLAPACRCFEDVALSRKIPVDSTTMSTPISPHGSVAGSLAEQTRISRPLTKIASPFATTSASSAPCTESCLRRWASVLASARSLTATASISGVSSAARKNTRPIRPNPLTPTRTPMVRSLMTIVEDSRSLPLEKSPDYRREGPTPASGAPGRQEGPGGHDERLREEAQWSEHLGRAQLQGAGD